jgi:hypothetical protein
LAPAPSSCRPRIRIITTAALTWAHSLSNDAAAETMALSATRVDLTGGAAFVLTPRVVAFGSVGRTVSHVDDQRQYADAERRAVVLVLQPHRRRGIGNTRQCTVRRAECDVRRCGGYTCTVPRLATTTEATAPRRAGSTLWRALSSWRTGSVALLSFSSGLPLGLVWYAIPDWMRDIGVDIRLVGLITLAQAPWAFKVVWSPLMDRYVPPFWGTPPWLDRRHADRTLRARPAAGRRRPSTRGDLGGGCAGISDGVCIGVAGHRHRRLRGGSPRARGTGRGRRRAHGLVSRRPGDFRRCIDYGGGQLWMAVRQRDAGDALPADVARDVESAGA